MLSSKILEKKKQWFLSFNPTINETIIGITLLSLTTLVLFTHPRQRFKLCYYYCVPLVLEMINVSLESANLCSRDYMVQWFFHFCHCFTHNRYPNILRRESMSAFSRLHSRVCIINSWSRETRDLSLHPLHPQFPL